MKSVHVCVRLSLRTKSIRSLDKLKGNMEPLSNECVYFGHLDKTEAFFINEVASHILRRNNGLKAYWD